MKEIISKSPLDTRKIGERLAEYLKNKDFLALVGELGSGKTVFVKGLAKGLGVKGSSYVNSPSFVIIKEYRGKKNLYHFDIYRLKNEKMLEDLGVEEYFYGEGITAMEWADKAPSIFPKEYLKVEFLVSGNFKRKIRLIPHGERFKKILEKFKLS